MKILHSALLSATALLFAACSPIGIATGLGAGAGVAVAQEGGVSRAFSDARIQAQINDLWFRNDVEAFTKLDMTVNQGRVLLTGVVQDPEQRVDAVRLAWQPEGVKQVINEIQIAEGTGIIGIARDNWITTRLRTALTLDRNIQSVNYSIDTVQGVVYLMGTAQNQAELNRVIETARTVPDVKRVVSYVKMSGSPLSDSPTQAGQGANMQPVGTENWDNWDTQNPEFEPKPPSQAPQTLGAPQSITRSEIKRESLD